MDKEKLRQSIKEIAELKDSEVDELIELFNRKVQSKNPKSEIELLIEAKNANSDPMLILPELGIKTHVYTLFIYNNILLNGNDTPENILSELKLSNDCDLLNTIGLMNFSTDWLQNPEEKIASLEEKGLKYIRQFAVYLINFFKELGI